MLDFLDKTTKANIRKYALGPVYWLANLVIYPAYLALPDRLWQLDRPIFVIGSPRSGTTLFARMFERHADLANWTEAGQVLQLNYYDPNADHLMEEKDVKAFDAARIKVFFGLFAKLSRKSRFMNKSPRNSLRIRYLKVLYPDALFIHLVRDGRAVVHSNFSRTQEAHIRRSLPYGGFCKPPNWRKHLTKSPITQFAYQWSEIVCYIRQTAAQVLGATNYLEVKYEDFCETPHRTLAQIDQFCQLSPERRRYDQIPLVFDSQNYKWQRDFAPEQVEQIEKIMNDQLVEYGYLRGN